jgi:hypothetical protein
MMARSRMPAHVRRSSAERRGSEHGWLRSGAHGQWVPSNHWWQNELAPGAIQHELLEV